MARRLVVIGAGPVGLTAALGAVARGFDTLVLEQGAIGSALRRWGSTRLFTPLAMNLAPEVAELLRGTLPPPDALLTGPEFVDAVLVPLANSAPLSGRVCCGQRVVAVGRAGLLRTEHAGHPVRAERPFRLLVEADGRERTIEADAVLDASGVYGHPLWMGAGGLPAKGERAHNKRIARDLGALEERLASFAGQRILLVGHGHSAANALLRLQSLADSGARVTWAVRAANLWPVSDVADDPLPERARVVAAANGLARTPPEWLSVLRRCSVESIASSGSALHVSLSGGREVSVDAIVSLTGYRPDLAPLSELALEIAPATEGSAGIARALANVTDCLSVPAIDARDLASGEPGFHLIGAKSYGRSRTFLLQTGYAQLTSILDGLCG